MYCPHCGKKVPSGKFCPYCGQRFQNPQDSQPFQGSDHSQAYQGPHTSPLFQGSSNVPPLREHSPQTDPPPSWGSSPRKPSSFVGFLVVAAVAVVAAVGLALGGGDILRGISPGLLLTLAAVFAFFLAVDLLGHKFLHLSRSLDQWILLAVVLTGLLSSGTGTLLSLTQRGSRGSQLDFAYRYLLEGHGEAAKEKAQTCSQRDATLIRLLADAVDRDYLSAYFEAGRVLEEEDLSESVRSQVVEMRSLAAEVLGIQMDSATGEISGSAGDLPLVGIDQEETSATLTESQRQERMTQLVTSICDQEGASQAMDSKTEELYRLDRAMTLEDLSDLDSSTVEELLTRYRDDEDVLQMATKYYARREDYSQAKELASRLVQDYPSERNLVIYTDLIAQEVKSGQEEEDEQDQEAQGLLDQAQMLEERAASLDTQNPSDQEQYDQLTNEAEDLRKQASMLDITRAVNYLLAKKPLGEDTSGLLDLQIAKLYLAAGERELAKDYIWKVVDHCGDLEENSPIREPLQEVVEAYNNMEAGESDPALTSAVNKLIRAQSQDVVSSSEGTVNGIMGNFVSSTLKYDRLSILIGKIETENYPTIRAYVNVSGEKDNRYGAAEGFAEGDFEVFDTQYQISDLRLVQDAEASQISIALVMDHSGSMSGTPLEDAKLAAEACANEMDRATQRMTLIPYDDTSSVAVALTDSAASLISGIRDLESAGGTNISGGIRTGLGELASAGGTRAIILLTDGQDGASQEEMDQVLAEAKQEGIAIFTVGLGEVNEAYLRNIAQTTGGKFLVAESSTELSDIYLLLQRYIVNNYCLEYQVTENPDTDPRSLTVAIPSYGVEDVKAYRISGEEVTRVEADTGIYPVSEEDLAVYALSPGSVSAGELSQGLTLTVRGSGFQEGMTVSVGNSPLTDVQVKDAGELTGKLQANLAAGAYAVQARLPDGRVDTLYQGFRVFRGGTVSTVQMGNVFIMADRIGLTSETGSQTQLTASGNVTINGFLYSTSELTIEPDAPLSEDSLSQAGQSALYLGGSGSVEGDGKLYASYAQAVETANSGNSMQNMLGHSFTENIFNGKDLILRQGTFSMDVGESDTDFGTGGYGQALSDELRDYSIKFPGFTEIGAAKVILYTDRLQLDAQALDFGDIEDNLVSSLTGGVKGTKKDREALVKKLGGKWSRFFPLSGSLSVALGARDVRVGGEVNLTLPDDKKFFLFPVQKLGLKINSLDPDYEYWSFTVGIQLPGVQLTSGSSQEKDGLEVSVGSYFWYPDSLEVAVSLDPGIPIFKVFNLTKVGGGMTGASGLFIQDDRVEKKDLTLKILAEADINVFKLLGWPQTGAARSITRWGELGKISDAEVVLNFSDLSLDISADLELLQQKIASAQLAISTRKFLIKANVGTELSCAGIDIGGDLEAQVSACWAGQNQDGVSALLGLGGQGHVRCSWANVNWDNQKVGLELTADIGASDGTTIAVKVYCNEDWARAWYNSEGLMLWDKFHYESTF